MNPKLLLGIAFFALAATITWFQLNGQFIWKSFKENTFLVVLLGIPISYCYIWATKYTVESMDGVMWPTRFIGFGIGVVVYANIPAAVAEKDDLVCFLGIDAYKLMLVNLKNANLFHEIGNCYLIEVEYNHNIVIVSQNALVVRQTYSLREWPVCLAVFIGT